MPLEVSTEWVQQIGLGKSGRISGDKLKKTRDFGASWYLYYFRDILIHRGKKKKINNLNNLQKLPNLQTLSESIHQLSVGFCLPVPLFEDPWLAQDIRSIVRMRWRHAHTNLGAKIDFSLRSRKSKIHRDFNETTVPGNPVTYNLSAFLLCLLSNWLQRIDFSHHLSSIFPQARTVPVESSSHTSWTDKIKRRPPTYSHSQCGRYIWCCSPRCLSRLPTISSCFVTGSTARTWAVYATSAPQQHGDTRT